MFPSLVLFYIGYESHKISQASWTAFVSVMSGKTKSVSDQQNSNVAATVTTNRKVLESIIDVVITLGRQGIAFRGHHPRRNSEGSDHGDGNNLGNFHEMLQLRVRGVCSELIRNMFFNAYNINIIEMRSLLSLQGVKRKII